MTLKANISRAVLGLTLMSAAALSWAQTGPGKGETLRVQDYPGGGNTLVRVAVSKQYCERYGIKCTLRQFPNGPIGTQAFIAGELDAAYVGGEIMLSAISRGADVKMISGSYAPQPFIVIARQDMVFPDATKGVQGVMTALKGLKVGVPARGSHAETMFTDMLVESGMTTKDITYVAVGGPATAVPPLVNKQIDAVIIFSPVDGICEVSKACKVVIDMRKGEGPKSARDSMGAAVPLWMKGKYVQENPNVLKAFRLALADAQTFMRDPANFEEVLQITDSYSKMPGESGPQIMRVTMRNSLSGFDTAVKPAALQAVIDYMVNNKQLPAGMKADTLIAH